MKLRTGLFLSLFISLVLTTGTAISTDFTNITPDSACKLISSDKNVFILDVRTPAEYHGELGHLKNATLIPVGELESRLDELSQYKTQYMVVYCRSGHRSGIASGLLAEHGFQKVHNLLGGMQGWNNAVQKKVPCKTKLLER